MKSVKFRYLTVALSTLGFAAAFAAPSRAESSSEQKNVPHWVASAQRVSSAAESQRVSIAAFLSFRNQAALKDLIAAQSTPGSPQYGKYLTPAQFRAQFAPTAADVARVQRTLQRMGFHVDLHARERLVRRGERHGRPGQSSLWCQPESLCL